MKVSVTDIARHIRHMIKTGGIECVGLGSDFDGITSSFEMKDASDLPILEESLRKNGFTEEEIEKIFYRNVLRVYKEIL